MNKQAEVNILLADGVNNRETAESMLRLGTVVYEKPTDWIENLKTDGLFAGQTIEGARNHEYADVSVITHNNKEYLIEYAH